MDHGHMDHGMPGMDHGPKCNMNVRQAALNSLAVLIRA